MAELPHDFPPAGQAALSKIKLVSGSVHDHVVKIINEYWGDKDKISSVDEGTWNRLISHNVNGSINALQRDLDKFGTDPEKSMWSGPAAASYVQWRQTFARDCLNPMQKNMIDVHGKLNEAIGKIQASRTRLIIMIITLAGSIGSAATSNPVGEGAAAVLALGCIGTYLEWVLNVQGDFDDLARGLEKIRDQQPVQLPPDFKTDAIADWDNWEHKNPKRAY